MLVRAAVVLPPPLAERVARLLPPGTPTYAIAPSRDAFSACARALCDFVVCSPALLGNDAAAAIRRLRVGQETLDVVVMQPDDDATTHAGLLADGCMAVLCDRVDDAALAEALRSLVDRHGATARGSIAASPDACADLLSSRDPAMRRVFEILARIAPTDTPVLLLGETGVGKERLARALHSQSLRAARSFVAVNCAALPDGLAESELFGHEAGAFTGAERSRRGVFELAHGGTLLLDEVGDLPLAVQAKLLRVLQDREIRPVGAERTMRVDVRIVAATNRDLAGEVRAGRFRADLYYRLDVVALEVPPLRARTADVPDLACRLIERSARRLGRVPPALNPGAMAALLSHDWPGNVRELEHVLERAVLLCEGHSIVEDDLSMARVRRTRPRSVHAELLELPWHDARARAIEQFERTYLEHALRESGGRIGVVARRTGLSERAVFGAMRRLGLRKEDFRGTRTCSEPEHQAEL